MTPEVVRRALGDIEEDTPEGKREMAAARIVVRARAILNRAFELSDMSQKDLAKGLGVTEGRVSQVLNGDGNLRLSTLARYLREMGYLTSIEAAPANESVKPLTPARRPRRARADHDVYAARIAAGDRFQVKVVIVPQGTDVGSAPEAPLRHVGTTSATEFRWSPMENLERVEK